MEGKKVEVKESERKLSLIEKLAKIRAISDVAHKGKKGYNYTYTDITEILANVTGGMKKYGVSLIPAIVPGTSNICQNIIETIKTDRTGNQIANKSTEMLFSAEMTFTWIDNENPDDTIVVPWYVTGSQSDPSQALGSGMTYTLRQFLTMFFQIAQSDQDVDAYRSKQKEAEAAEDRAAAESIIGKLDAMVKAYIADHNTAETKEAMRKFFTKYVKSADYTKVKEPALAAKMMNDFKEQFGLNKEE